MSDPNAPVVVTPAAPTITIDPSKPPTPPAVPGAGTSDEKPAWLDARLAQARSAALKDLGFETPEDAKKALDELNAKRDAEKTAAQKASELGEALKSEKQSSASLREALAIVAKAQMKGLTDAQRKAVTDLAGDDPAKQIKTIEALSATWAGQPAATTTTTTAATDPKGTPPATAPAPKPADTAPSQGAPSPTVLSPPDPKAVHAELKKTNPIIAARYAAANGLHQ